jgi:c-di-GMP-binding flagellar brake protein YcgR
LPYAADLGRLLNKKIQLIMRQTSIAKNMVDLDIFEQTQVDISATGMAFPSRKAMILGQSLLIDLILQSGKQHLKLLAKVVNCALDNESLADGDASFTHVVRVHFSDMSEDVSEFLIQYLVKRQGALLKSERLKK